LEIIFLVLTVIPSKLHAITSTHLVLLYHPVFRELLRWQWKCGANTSANDRSWLSGLQWHFNRNFTSQLLEMKQPETADTWKNSTYCYSTKKLYSIKMYLDQIWIKSTNCHQSSNACSERCYKALT